MKILSLREDLDKTTTQLKTNSKIEKNIEESKRSIVKEEKANSNTCILRRSHDQEESREVTAQRYPISSMVTATSVTTMVTKPFIAELMTRSLQE